MTIRLGVDALNLMADRRGMGRFARKVLQAAYDASDIEVTLIVRPTDTAQECSTVLGRDVTEVIFPQELRRRALEVVWYPWNAMRFTHRAVKVVSIHDVFAFTEPQRNHIARLREQRPIRRAVREADCLVTPSQWSAGEIVRTFGVPADRIRVIPHAPEPFWAATERARPQPYFLFVCGPEKRKNAAFLFAAFARAFEPQEAELVIVGTLAPHDHRTLRDSGISFNHLQPNDAELRDLYSGAVALAVPSLGEGFGLMAIEAIACGTPVLAANAAALPEVCGIGAELLDPNDVDVWATALRSAFHDPAFRNALQTRAKRRSGQFDRTAPGRQMLELIRAMSLHTTRNQRFPASAP